MENYYRFRNLIVLLQFHNSLVFMLLLFLFLINLIGWTIKILPAQLGGFKKAFFPLPNTNIENLLPGESTILSDWGL